MSGETGDDFSVATRTLKLRKPVRKADNAPSSSSSEAGAPSDAADGGSTAFQVPSADLLIGPRRPENADREMPPPVVTEESDSIAKEEEEEKTDVSSVPPSSDSIDGEVDRPVGRPVPYREPKWSGCPGIQHGLEVIKTGRLLHTIDLSKKPFTVFGRATQCDVEIEHPSASRYHAVLQCRPSSSHGEESNSGDSDELGDDGDGRDEFYVYDLGSSNNTFVNKEKIQPNTYYRLRLGHQLRFGFSTRMYVLVAGQPDTTAALIEADAAEEERDVLEQRLRKAQAFGRDPEPEKAAATASTSGRIVKHRDDPNAITWGFQEDDIEEEAVMEDRPDFEALQSARNGKAQYFEKDPKKALEAFFDREGLDIEFETDESGSGSKHAYIGRIKLPIQTAMGDSVYGEGTASKKKDAIAAAALDACRLLDTQGMLREHQHEKGASRKRRPDDEDFYDSDEDSYLDRTGMAEKKRRKRMDRNTGKSKGQEALTHGTLKKQLDDIVTQLKDAEEKLEKAVAAEKMGEESLDDFMSSIGNRLDRSQRAKLRSTISALKKEEAQMSRLVALTAPTALPDLKPPPATASRDGTDSSTASQSDSHDGATAPAKKKGYGFVGRARHSALSGHLRIPSVKNTPAGPLPDRTVPDNVEEIEEEGDGQDRAVPVAEKEMHSPDSGKQASAPDPQSKVAAVLSTTKPEAAEPTVKAVVESPSISEQPDKEGAEEAESRSARRRKRRHQHTAEHSLAAAASSVKAAVKEDSLDDWKRDPNVDAWMPPQNQSGDGNTHLNAKFGY